MTVKTPVLERVMKRDRFIVILGLILVSAASWLYILAGAGMAAEPMPDGAPMMRIGSDWTPAYFALMFAMWWVMMVAMMLPSAAPLVLLFATVHRKNRLQGGAYVPSAIFAGGYLIAWGGFSLLAVIVQWGFERLLLLSPMMTTTSAYLGGALLIGAGVYQLTPLKHACLRHCRSPMNFIAHHWREGAGGAFRMGVEQGLFCLGCCWVLMVLLFHGGVLDLWWIGGLALYILIEKLAPAGHWLGRFAGALLVAWGVFVFIGASASN
jgi:predicted metal-binding membrane protein